MLNLALVTFHVIVKSANTTIKCTLKNMKIYQMYILFATIDYFTDLFDLVD